MKTCSKCKILKELTDFYPNKDPRCKECHKSCRRERYKANPSKEIAKQAIWYLNNKERILAYQKTYRSNNLERCMELCRQSARRSVEKKRLAKLLK